MNTKEKPRIHILRTSLVDSIFPTISCHYYNSYVELFYFILLFKFNFNKKLN